MLRFIAIALAALLPAAVTATGLYRDYNGDAKSELSWRYTSTGAKAVWL